MGLWKRIADYNSAHYDTYGGVDVAEIEADTEMGLIRVLAAHDCGRPMNPTQTVSQINDGVIQGISYALYENRLIDPNYRLMVNPNLLQELQCWYFRSEEYQCLRKGKEICFAFAGLNQYQRMDYGTCPSLAPSSAAVALLGLNTSVELTSARRGKRTVAIQNLYVHPDANPTKFNVLEPDELLTAATIPQPAPGTRSAYQKCGEKRSNDWAIADAGVVLEMEGNVCRRAAITMGAA